MSTYLYWKILRTLQYAFYAIHRECVGWMWNLPMERFKCAEMVWTQTSTQLQYTENVSMHTIWFPRLLCKSCCVFKTLEMIMTDQCSQKQWGQSVYRHWKNKCIHSQICHCSTLQNHKLTFLLFSGIFPVKNKHVIWC